MLRVDLNTSDNRWFEHMRDELQKVTASHLEAIDEYEARLQVCPRILGLGFRHREAVNQYEAVIQYESRLHVYFQQMPHAMQSQRCREIGGIG